MPVRDAETCDSDAPTAICIVEALAGSELLIVWRNADVAVPFGITETAVNPFTVLDWNSTRLAGVALLKSPVMRLPVPVKFRLPESVRDATDTASVPLLVINVPDASGSVTVRSEFVLGEVMVTVPVPSGFPLNAMRLMCIP